MKTPKTGQAKVEFYNWLANEKKIPHEQIQEIALHIEKICNSLLEESEKHIVELLKSIKRRV